MALDRDQTGAVATLPCGQDLDALYEDLDADDLTGHQRTCPHCRQATVELVPLRRATVELQAAGPPPPPGFVDTVMRRIRSQAHRGRTIPLPAEPQLTLTISEHAAAAILAVAADAVSSVIVIGARFPDSTDHTRVRLAISLHQHAHAPTVADQIRHAVRAAAATQLGIHIQVIDVDVDDVHSGT